MMPTISGHRTGALRGLALAVLLVSLWPLHVTAAAPEKSDAREKLRYEQADFFVEHRASATAQDLAMPFYPAAKAGEGFVYRLTDTEDKLLNQYATVKLTTGDAVRKVAEYYTRELPGHPKPEQLRDSTGERWVLAVASSTDVRTVTIRPQSRGCEIELTRAGTPQQLKQPPASEQQPREPSGRRGPRGPRGPRRPGGRGQEV